MHLSPMLCIGCISSFVYLVEMGSLPMVGRTAQSIVKTSSPGATPLLVPSSCFRDRPNSRSPIESPPLSKKPLRFVETGRLFSKALDSPLSCILGARSPGAQENRSILKNGSQETTCKNRKVNFRQKVLVFHFDRNEGGHVCLESQVLSVEPEVKNVLRPSNAFSSTTSSTNSTTSASNPLSRQSDTIKNRLESSNGGTNLHPAMRGTSTPQQQVLATQKNLEVDFPTQNVQFHFAVNESRTSVLRFSLPLGTGTSAGDVIVKANKVGNRVRILGAENCSREINERFGLPVRVDPYRISARMDSSGMLFVEAPILSGEQKNGLLSGRKSL